MKNTRFDLLCLGGVGELLDGLAAQRSDDADGMTDRVDGLVVGLLVDDAQFVSGSNVFEKVLAVRPVRIIEGHAGHLCAQGRFLWSYGYGFCILY